MKNVSRARAATSIEPMWQEFETFWKKIFGIGKASNFKTIPLCPIKDEPKTALSSKHTCLDGSGNLSHYTSPVIYLDDDDDKVKEASMFFINITKWVKNDAKEEKLLMLINYMDDDKN